MLTYIACAIVIELTEINMVQTRASKMDTQTCLTLSMGI